VFAILGLRSLYFALAGAIGVWKGPQPSEGLQAVTVGIDVDPTGNAATTLGTLERCTSVANSAGSQFTIDVFIDEIPSGQNIAGFGYSLHFDASRLVLAAQDHSLLLASAPGSQPFDTLGDRVPDTDGSHTVAVADFGPEEVGPVKGVLGRYAVEVLAGAPNGVAEFSLSAVDMGGKEPGVVVTVDQILSACAPTWCAASTRPAGSPEGIREALNQAICHLASAVIPLIIRHEQPRLCADRGWAGPYSRTAAPRR